MHYSATVATTTTSTGASSGALGVKPVMARGGTEHDSGLGTRRRVVERAFAHLHWFRRLRANLSPYLP